MMGSCTYFSIKSRLEMNYFFNSENNVHLEDMVALGTIHGNSCYYFYKISMVDGGWHDVNVSACSHLEGSMQGDDAPALEDLAGMVIASSVIRKGRGEVGIRCIANLGWGVHFSMTQEVIG